MRTHGFHTSSRTLLLVLALTLACATTAHADTWSTGQVVTNTQLDWATPPGSTLLTNNFFSIYTTGALDLGGPLVMEFTSPAAILAYMPSNAIPLAGQLNSSISNPTTTSAGLFGGEVLALRLNVDFSDAGLLLGTSHIPFGNLVLQNLSATPNLNGLTVRQFLGDASQCLGGGSCIDNIIALFGVTQGLNFSFQGGIPATVNTDTGFTFSAQTNLEPPPGSVVATPEPSALSLLASGLISLGFFRRRFLHT